jgi:Recombinase
LGESRLLAAWRIPVEGKRQARHPIDEKRPPGVLEWANPPLGYKLVEVEKRGTKIKKKLDLDPVEAETVQLIFKLYLQGNGSSGALGVKDKWLNARGYRTRRGKTFGVGHIHKLLTNTVYIGRWRFNVTSSKTRKRKAGDEGVEIPVSAIIEIRVATCRSLRRDRPLKKQRVLARNWHDDAISPDWVRSAKNLIWLQA